VPHAKNEVFATKSITTPILLAAFPKCLKGVLTYKKSVLLCKEKTLILVYNHAAKGLFSSKEIYQFPYKNITRFKVLNQWREAKTI
jgi:hypothetical protein